jgi:Zn-dependent protease with chaperone function
VEILGWLYDGKSSARRPAHLRLIGEQLQLTVEGDETAPLTFARKTVVVRERVGGNPRVLEFPGGMRFETDENDLVDKHLAGMNGMRLVNWLEANWIMVVISVGLLVAFTYAGYRWVLPVAARKIAYAASPEVLTYVSKTAIEFMEEEFEPSLLEGKDLDRVRDVFQTLRKEYPDYKLTLHRYQGKHQMMNVNAFALPDGSIVMMDGLGKLLTDPDELMGVLLHELGHVVYRHGMQGLVQGLVVSGFFLYISGGADWSTVFGALTMSSFSREHEREADYFSANQMIRLGKRPSALADALSRMERELKMGDLKIPGFLSSHPLTKEREAYLRSYDPKPEPKPAGEPGTETE